MDIEVMLRRFFAKHYYKRYFTLPDRLSLKLWEVQTKLPAGPVRSVLFSFLSGEF